jgi:hypothetical protein
VKANLSLDQYLTTEKEQQTICGYFKENSNYPFFWILNGGTERFTELWENARLDLSVWEKRTYLIRQIKVNWIMSGEDKTFLRLKPLFRKQE